MCYFLNFLLKILSYGDLTKKYTFISWEKNHVTKSLRWEPNEQHLSIIPNSCPSNTSYLMKAGRCK